MKKWVLMSVILTGAFSLSAMDKEEQLDSQKMHKLFLFKRVSAIADWMRQEDMPTDDLCKIFMHCRHWHSYTRFIAKEQNRYSMKRQQLQSYISHHSPNEDDKGLIDEHLADIHEIEDYVTELHNVRELIYQDYTNAVAALLKDYSPMSNDLKENPPRISEIHILATLK